jgi:uncharacterized small protein (DUF1192 family)
MGLLDEDEPSKPATHAIGEDLTTLSEEELEERIEMLKREIERVGTELKGKRVSRDAAATFFKGSQS